MHARLTPLTVAALLCLASLAFAMAQEPRTPSPNPTPAGLPGTNAGGSGATTPRQEAEASYALAYEEVAKAKQELESGKAKQAEKKFRRAIERCEKAVAFDERYHEAWNLLGYSARKVGDYDLAFKAYDRCLAIKPDYAPAREYLGEAWLDRGEPKKAREQLVWLERLGAAAERKTLQTRYDAWVAAHPDSAAAPAAPPDSTAPRSSGH